VLLPPRVPAPAPLIILGTDLTVEVPPPHPLQEANLPPANLHCPRGGGGGTEQGYRQGKTYFFYSTGEGAGVEAPVL
jgi:hypothetical protein